MSSAPQPSHPGAAAPARSVSPVPGSVQSEAVDRGRNVRTLGEYSQDMFYGVMSVEGFADVLRVPVKAIPLIVPTQTSESALVHFEVAGAAGGECSREGRQFVGGYCAFAKPKTATATASGKFRRDPTK